MHTTLKILATTCCVVVLFTVSVLLQRAYYEHTKWGPIREKHRLHLQQYASQSVTVKPGQKIHIGDDSSYFIYAGRIGTRWKNQDCVLFIARESTDKEEGPLEHLVIERYPLLYFIVDVWDEYWGDIDLNNGTLHVLAASQEKLHYAFTEK